MVTSALAFGNTVTGSADPQCPSGAANDQIEIFDCDVNESPPVCYNGNDVLIAVASKDPVTGAWTAFTQSPLKPGQTIYASDLCFDPVRVGAPLVVALPSPAPALSATMLSVLVGMLALVGLLGVARRGSE